METIITAIFSKDIVQPLCALRKRQKKDVFVFDRSNHNQCLLGIFCERTLLKSIKSKLCQLFLLCDKLHQSRRSCFRQRYQRAPTPLWYWPAL